MSDDDTIAERQSSMVPFIVLVGKKWILPIAALRVSPMEITSVQCKTKMSHSRQLIVSKRQSNENGGFLSLPASDNGHIMSASIHVLLLSSRGMKNGAGG